MLQDTAQIRRLILDLTNTGDAAAFRANLSSLQKSKYLDQLLDENPDEWDKEVGAMTEMLAIAREAKRKPNEQEGAGSPDQGTDGRASGS